jgi:hypothetical protein
MQGLAVNLQRVPGQRRVQPLPTPPLTPRLSSQQACERQPLRQELPCF